MPEILNRCLEIRKQIPDHVTIVAAAKTRTPDEINQAVEAGINIIGENYVQEAEKVIESLNGIAQWHMIGHLQRNKAKKAVELFDMIETLDSIRLARAIEKRCADIDKIMPVLVEINSGRETNKTGILPEKVDEFLELVSGFKHIKIQGLMTMGPAFGDPENARPFFRDTKQIFDRIGKTKIPNVDMQYLSMGMSNSYHVAIEEGSNMIRLGTILFGERNA